jgi:deferrochelatase/peroxidase EfeB
MTLANAPSLVVCFPPGDAVEHRILTIPENRGQEAARFLRTLRNEFSFGPDGGSADTWMSIGFSFAGLEAVNMPESYLRVFRRLAPAFTQGAVRRSVNVSDSGESAPLHWEPGFGQEHAHVLVSWHGARREVAKRSSELAKRWDETFSPIGSTLSSTLTGQRLGAPPGQQGQWVHFGFRDGLSEVCIDDSLPAAPDRRKHLPGSLLLGHVNDAGFNEFALTRAPEKVRRFFRDSSFGVLRKIQQEVKAFEAQVDKWAVQMGQAIAHLPQPRDFVKAKLCGRWPDGRQLLPGELQPSGSLALDFDKHKDKAGEGCPFGSHVRRMRAAPDTDGNMFDRPLQRRGVPYGPAAWAQSPVANAERGLLGQFFCASLEDQFEHLLSQWAARPPLGLAAMDRALDPFGGSRQDADAALAVPLKDKPTQLLRGFSAWTTAKGTMYAWHPGRAGLFALLDNDFVPEKDERPWL